MPTTATSGAIPAASAPPRPDTIREALGNLAHYLEEPHRYTRECGAVDEDGNPCGWGEGAAARNLVYACQWVSHVMGHPSLYEEMLELLKEPHPGLWAIYELSYQDAVDLVHRVLESIPKPTIEEDTPMPTPKNIRVSCQLSLNKVDKIKQIRLFHHMMASGLKAAKELVEVLIDRHQTNEFLLTLTPHQFGIMVSLLIADDTLRTCGFNWWDPKLIPLADTRMTDLTNV